MEKVYRDLLFKHELQQSVGNNVKTNHQFRPKRRNVAGEKPDHNDRDNRNIVKTSKDTNDLPQPLWSKLQKRRHNKREQRNHYTRAFGNAN